MAQESASSNPPAPPCLRERYKPRAAIPTLNAHLQCLLLNAMFDENAAYDKNDDFIIRGPDDGSSIKLFMTCIPIFETEHTVIIEISHLPGINSTRSFGLKINTSIRTLSGILTEFHIHLKGFFWDDEKQEICSVSVPGSPTGERQEMVVNHMAGWWEHPGVLRASLRRSRNSGWAYVEKMLRDFMFCYFDECGERRGEADAENRMRENRRTMEGLSMTDETIYVAI